jgi:hypothetical protein
MIKQNYRSSQQAISNKIVGSHEGVQPINSDVRYGKLYAQRILQMLGEELKQKQMDIMTTIDIYIRI